MFKLIVFFCRNIPSVTGTTSQSTGSQSWHFVPAGNTTLKSTGERPTYELYTILDQILTLRKFNFPSNTVSTECENQIHRLLLLICLSYKDIYIYVCTEWGYITKTTCVEATDIYSHFPFNNT
jgi:hypothetical protein